MGDATITVPVRIHKTITEMDGPGDDTYRRDGRWFYDRWQVSGLDEIARLGWATSAAEAEQLAADAIAAFTARLAAAFPHITAVFAVERTQHTCWWPDAF